MTRSVGDVSVEMSRLLSFTDPHAASRGDGCGSAARRWATSLPRHTPARSTTTHTSQGPGAIERERVPTQAGYGSKLQWGRA